MESCCFCIMASDWDWRMATISASLSILASSLATMASYLCWRCRSCCCSSLASLSVIWTCLSWPFTRNSSWLSAIAAILVAAFWFASSSFVMSSLASSSMRFSARFRTSAFLSAFFWASFWSCLSWSLRAFFKALRRVVLSSIFLLALWMESLVSNSSMTIFCVSFLARHAILSKFLLSACRTFSMKAALPLLLASSLLTSCVVSGLLEVMWPICPISILRLVSKSS
mmetsp:Transcript_82892/g.230236  ORF Transcript_82892/g.230236 Transcript_82892/m.230236 type:complete len:227 (-) Transcript_82892:157-837(-)